MFSSSKNEAELRAFVLQYSLLLRKWQKSINLVSNSTLENLEERHFEDSFQLGLHVPIGVSRCVDFGSGGGFPALPLAFLNPNIEFTLVESDERKSFFLETVSRETNLNNVRVVNKRIEDAFVDFGSCDLFTARAFASLIDIFDLVCQYQDYIGEGLSIPFLGLKGGTVEKEVLEAKKAYSFDYKLSSSNISGGGYIIYCENIRRLPCE